MFAVLTVVAVKIFMNSFSSLNKGFSLLEMIVVISVLALLISIVIPRFIGMKDQGKISQAKTELRQMKAAVVSYYLHRNPHTYPATTSTVGASRLSPDIPQIITSTPPYDPFGASTTTEYNYTLSSNGSYYVIWSIGPDGSSATTAISNAGAVTTGGDDTCITNGRGCAQL